MALRQSTALRDFKLRDGPMKRALYGGVLKGYSGTQPATADTATAGTLLFTVSLSSGAITAEVLSNGSITLTGGAAGSIDTVTINSVQILPAAVVFNTDLTTTAADLATALNNSMILPHYVCTSSGAVVTIKALPGTGTTPNGYTVVSATTTITKTDANMASGVAQVNGLTFGSTATGQMVISGTWSANPVAAGTLGWLRFQGSITDGGGASTTLIRLDMAASDAAVTLSTTNVQIGVPVSCTSFNITDPAS